ncbi:transcription termination factor Rho [Actinosynnema pretiosum]|uniref:Transcription termination factor Rho n=1 Tax=Actinosynnema pretiosum TaxID=42197 RepID=A0A290Z8L2_9PSEU|nr:transcription termination factor Rho [Actinosynnema pretiosum]
MTDVIRRAVVVPHPGAVPRRPSHALARPVQNWRKPLNTNTNDTTTSAIPTQRAVHTQHHEHGDDHFLVTGLLDTAGDSTFLRTNGYTSGEGDVRVPQSLVRRWGLRKGDEITGCAKPPAEERKHARLDHVHSVNDLPPERLSGRPEFTDLPPLHPRERLRLASDAEDLTGRVIDLVMPTGKGQRALISAPPKAGKTSALRAIARGIGANHPECHVMLVLVGERPEEVTDLRRSVHAEVAAATFDQSPQEQIAVAELALERARRLVELGRDVVILLDSLTRLGRAYNLAAPTSGRVLSGGVSASALHPPKRFLGSARNVEGGGSLTIFATALVETGSTGDTVIHEEYRGTGNAELKLDRSLADRRVHPAVDIRQSSTRRDELLMSPAEQSATRVLRRVLQMREGDRGIDVLLDGLRKTSTNAEFLHRLTQTTPVRRAIAA